MQIYNYHILEQNIIIKFQLPFKVRSLQVIYINFNEIKKNTSSILQKALIRKKDLL